MGIKVTVKAKFGTSKESVEKFGSDKYLMYFRESGVNEVFAVKRSLSINMGVPVSKIEFLGYDVHKDFVFEVL